ncbi:MAG TPA: inositol monophosphatase family protein [Patescibacteria group bacterium]|nr:inositol monophosphatase family protein [Patescibacteria group bacterium]
MVSKLLTSGWPQVLNDAATNVRKVVRGALVKRATLDVKELKNLLDDEAQNAIADTLRENGEPVTVVSEEGDYKIGEDGPCLIVDPVDGTTNLARGIPLAVTSLALSETPLMSGVQIGVIVDLYTGETYRAERDRGAWRGGKRLHTTGTRNLKEAVVSIDISKGSPVKPVEQVIYKARSLRQLGCSALATSLVASGVMDAHVDVRGSLRTTDIAAGLLILREAGGTYTINGELGKDFPLIRDEKLRLIAATNPHILEEIISLLQGGNQRCASHSP